MAAHLSYGRVNLNVLREAVRRELREFLDKCAGSKAIVWDEYLTGPFGLIAQYSLLKEHEVEKMFTLKGNRLPAADVKNIIFFVRPRLELMDIIAENVLSEDRRGPTRDFHILFVPRRSLLCEQRLKDLGVLGSFIHREEYSLDLIPFDGDLLSMESEGAFKECYLEGDQTSLYHAAKGLMTLQALYGTIPQIFGKGECARQVANMMIRMKREFTGSQNSIFPVFDNLLLLDRNVDLLTPLATQLTYEGLIDEIYGIQNTSEDFFDKLTVEQEFMSGIDTDKVNNYIEDCIAQKHSLIKVLRLVCLQSVCNSGLKQKVLDYYKREILQTYGYEHILTLHNLEKAGLLKPQTGGRNNYPTIRKTLRLWMDDVNEQNPTDISYVYSGYAPLSVRLAQLLSRPGWRSIEEVLRILPGPHFEERQPLPTGLQKKRQPGENRVTLIFFLGGITFAEIAALRFLSQLEDGGTEYVIATTKLMNGTSWIEALMEKPF
ncbi:vacuolar protein sorting-associated protein 33A isoform X2 [Nomascus leucogenys]|uniref:vacuolar protein sorting-associated protein 33A isoform X2 n=1 Tax=Nomascus leucogenys TaxID=61853 RepID=UPI00122D5933|nr:vacuolar protein sorting-associated protein 33A isoform X2 [Nomascus leucogenys]XP_032024341.1 vacuolar protein sorting-associated protein 33A isoform X3 [Hylobates moloch]XP_055092953.1 vacuolar protein sorting-associated protein 33A isoform X4 [Symphalangus syndactylus]